VARDNGYQAKDLVALDCYATRSPWEEQPMSDSLKTTVVGSYSVPDWYEALQEDVVKGRVTPEAFADAKAVAARAAIADLEHAGIDVVSDGELFRRDDNRFGPPNAMINYFAAKIPGFAHELKPKTGITPVAPEASLPAPVVKEKLQPAQLGLVEELKFLRENTSKPVKIAMTGPHMFARVCWDEFYKDHEALAMDMAAIINAEFRRLDQAGCDVIQLDEPILWFLPKDQPWGVKLINACFDGVKTAKRALHLCQGNYNPDPNEHKGIRIFPSDFQSVVPIIEGAEVDVILMAFSSLGVEDLSCLKNFPARKTLGVGSIDVQTHDVETPEQVAKNIERVAKQIGYERVWVNPDCGLNHLPRDIAFAKLRAMAQGAKLLAGAAV
jgi:5-methyltetrahydropteroyltriglutamate--homocysteine methyltransferase